MVNIDDLSSSSSFSSTIEDDSCNNFSYQGGSHSLLRRIRLREFSVLQSRERNINFRRNGGELMKQLKVSMFTKSELAKATNNYDDQNKLGNSTFGSVHTGTLAGDIMVVVKKPKDVHASLLKRDYQSELECLAKRSCKNVVKLIGICLETKIPTLVYEYVPNGTLFEHIHPAESTNFKSSTILKSWGDRFRIATETALALNYMHSSMKPPIFHGNIKSANILLDKNYSVKISDFGTSVLISPEHRHIVATQSRDSSGYIDPEYRVTGKLTTQSDVYSFGVVLVELLTEKKPDVTESGRLINIIHCFISSVKGDTLPDVIDFEGASEDEMERARSIAMIAVRCLDQSGVNRPTMAEVAKQLASINRSSTVEEENEENEDDEETKREVDAETLSGTPPSGGKPAGPVGTIVPDGLVLHPTIRATEVCSPYNLRAEDSNRRLELRKYMEG